MYPNFDRRMSEVLRATQLQARNIEALNDALACILPRELGLSREQLHTLRQRIQTNLNAAAPTRKMMGTAFEADELYRHAGEKKPAAS
jgi:uncharacterized coiled-coil protein SlyX